MTDVTSLLAGIKTRAERATEGPFELIRYPRGGGRMWTTKNRVLIADTYNTSDREFLFHARTDVPRLVAALEAMAGLHKPRQFDPLKDGVWFGQSDFDYEVCDHCVMTCYPCPTITAVVAALGGGE